MVEQLDIEQSKPAGSFYSLNEKHLFKETLEKYKNYQFEQKKQIDTGSDMKMILYDIDFYGMGLDVLQTFDEGEFVFANRLRIRRYYVDSTTCGDQGMYTYCTEIIDITKNQHKGSIGIAHGAAQCSDVFLEAGFHFALNGFCVHLVDYEGFGYTGGHRINGLSIEAFHHQITTLIEQARPEIPLFLLGHSMGGLTIATFLGRNPWLANKLAGVIYSAPFFGVHESNPVDAGKKAITSLLSGVLDEFAVVAPIPLHRVTRNKAHVRYIVNCKKAAPLMSLKLIDSFFRNHDSLQNNAKKVTYPYHLLLAQNDTIVSNI